MHAQRYEIVGADRDKRCLTGSMDSQPAEEIVALYGPGGVEVGSAPRSRVRAKNLHHGATAAVVFDPTGRIFVHQRTWTKDLFPGLYDFAAGGVLNAGEAPDAAAVREAHEELGITTALVKIGEADYSDAHTSYRAFLYWTVSDEPLRLQPEEVQGGDWMTRAELLAAMDAEPEQFMPDSVSLLGPWLRGLTRVPPA